METRKIDTLVSWSKNPRSINQEDFDRLKKQLTKFGQYKPLIITDKGVVLGGNMRLRAMQELGFEDIWVSVVEADDDKTKLEYALSDNDRAGVYDEQQLAELVFETKISPTDFKVDIFEPVYLKDMPSLADIFDNEFPSEEEFQKHLEENADKELFKFITTTEVANKLRDIIDENQQQSEDDGDTLLRMLT